jgi:hypothetical protein
VKLFIDPHPLAPALEDHEQGANIQSLRSMLLIYTFFFVKDKLLLNIGHMK